MLSGDIKQLEQKIVDLKNRLMEGAITNLDKFEFNSKNFQPINSIIGHTYLPSAYFDKNISSISQVVDEIKNQSRLNHGKESLAYKEELMRLKHFLKSLYHCIIDVVRLKNDRIDEKEINARLIIFLNDTKTHRNLPAKGWRKLTKPVIHLCRTINSTFKNSLASLGLFTKPRRQTDNSSWADLTDKSNKLAHTLRNVGLK